MKLLAIASMLNATIINGSAEQEIDVRSACGSDLMSDVLAHTDENAMLLTGLTNPHVVRTAEMLDLCLLVFVRGKVPDAETLQMAAERGIAVMNTPKTLYEACGLLYAAGLPPCGLRKHG